MLVVVGSVVQPTGVAGTTPHQTLVFFFIIYNLNDH